MLVGFGVSFEKVPFEINIQLGQYVTVFHAEVLCILLCEQIYIFSDSKSVNVALQTPINCSIIVYE